MDHFRFATDEKSCTAKEGPGGSLGFIRERSAPSQTAGRAQLGGVGGGKWLLSLGRRRPPSKGKGVLEEMTGIKRIYSSSDRSLCKKLKHWNRQKRQTQIKLLLRN